MQFPDESAKLYHVTNICHVKVSTYHYVPLSRYLNCVVRVDCGGLKMGSLYSLLLDRGELELLVLY